MPKKCHVGDAQCGTSPCAQGQPSWSRKNQTELAGSLRRIAGVDVYDGNLIQRAAGTGIILQLTLVVIGHYVGWVRDNAYEFGGMMIAGVAGLLYARDFAKGYAKGALGGAIVGGACGVIGLCAANILGDVPLIALAIGSVIVVLVGAIGGLFGQMAANIRNLNA
jgi:hypothetical protein